MPELPEVETVKRTLEKNYLGRKILYTEVLLPRMILSPIDEFIKNTKNVTIISFSRIGKYLIFNLSNSYSFISHLRMEGKYILRKEEDPIITHTRVVFHLDRNEKLCYDDSRSFGIMKMDKTENILSCPELTKLGPEPFAINDPAYLKEKFNHKNCEIKSALLDQTIMTGLGNIYVDEVLYKCKINPFKKANSLSLNECKDILNASVETLNKAIELGGSTVSSYHPEKGVDGRFQNQLLAYGREKQKCIRCGSLMLKDKINGRGTTYCPICQNVAISVGITGKIASGKSTVLSYLRNKGYKVFSSDEEVKNLYTKNEVKKGLVDLFGEQVINDNGTVSFGFIKNIIVTDNEKRKKLENFVHPLVKKSINQFIAKNKNEKIIFIEVPLMFETKFNLLFDYILGITCSRETQIKNLKNRKSTNVNLDLVLNSTTLFDKNIKKCDYLINNDGTLDDLYKQINVTLENMRQE